MVHTDPDCPHVEAARGQFSLQMEGAVGGQIEEDAITSREEEQEVPNEQKPDAETFTEAVNTDCTHIIVLINEEFSQLMEDEYRMLKRVFKDLAEAEKEVQLVNYLDDDEIFQEVKYKLPGAMRKNIIPNTRFLNSTNSHVALEDHTTTATQVGNNNYMEVPPEAGNIRAQQVGRSNRFTASSGPSIQGYELTVKTPDTDYELCVEIKNHVDDNIDNINISLKPHNARVESTSLGSVIIRVAVEPGTKLGPVWLRLVITKILSEDIIAKLPKGTRMEVSVSASLPLTPLDVDIFEFEGENEATHWITEYTSDIHRKDETGRSILHQAARIGNRAVVILSLKSGCLVKDQDRQGNTPLHYAAMSGQMGVSVSQLLVDGGASIDVVNSGGCTPLHLAVTERNLEVVELFARKFGAKESNPTANQKIEISSLVHLLVKQGADVNALNRQSLTPLQVAASSQRFDVIVALLTEGADANAVHKNGQTPLHHVFGVNKPNWEIDYVTEAYRLMKHLGVKPVTQSSGYTCKPDDNGASEAPSSVLDIPDSEGNTPLQSAIKSNFTQAAIILLDAGANANTKNKKKDTPLHTVAGNTNIENTTTEHDAVVKIIECSRDVNVTDKEGNTPLMLAVEKNKNISPLLKAGADVNAQNIHGDTPLIIAVKHASRIMETLLEAGSDVCTSNTQGDTVLMIAADSGCEINDSTLGAIATSADVSSEGDPGYASVYTCDTQSRYKHSGVISELINVGGEVNFEDDNGNTPMTVAVRHGIADNVEALLKAGADIDVQDKEGNTPLMIAVKKGRNISRLLKAGANANSKNRQGRTALHLVYEHQHDMYEAAVTCESFTEQLIAAGADVNVQDKEGNTPLMMAVENGWNILTLLRVGANVNSKNRLGRTALHLVCEHQHDMFGDAVTRESFIEQLIAAGADVNVQDEKGNTPLMMAVKKGWNISPLLKAGANVNSKNLQGRTALHLVCKHQYNMYEAAVTRKRFTEQLIAAGADVNAQDEDGNTPLMMAVETELDISPLLTAGADVNSKNGLGETALHLVCEHQHDMYGATVKRKSFTEQLIAAGADVNVQDKKGNTPLMMAVKKGWNISPLLKAGANVNSKNRQGRTALHLVCERKHYMGEAAVTRESFTEQLIAAGADVNAQDEKGNTPLMMAVETERDISPLLTAGADVNSKNRQGRTALHLVCKHQYNMYEAAVTGKRFTEQLIAAGADVNAQDEDGNTPLHICVENNDYHSVKVLLSVLRTDVKITNRNGKSALHLAKEAVSPTHFGIWGKFRKRPQKYFGKQGYRHVPEEDKKAILQAILSKHQDPNAEVHSDRTHLNIVKVSGDIFLEDPLLSGGITSESEFGLSRPRPSYSSK